MKYLIVILIFLSLLACKVHEQPKIKNETLVIGNQELIIDKPEVINKEE